MEFAKDFIIMNNYKIFHWQAYVFLLNLQTIEINSKLRNVR